MKNKLMVLASIGALTACSGGRTMRGLYPGAQLTSIKITQPLGGKLKDLKLTVMNKDPDEKGIKENGKFLGALKSMPLEKDTYEATLKIGQTFLFGLEATNNEGKTVSTKFCGGLVEYNIKQDNNSFLISICDNTGDSEGGGEINDGTTDVKIGIDYKPSKKLPEEDDTDEEKTPEDSNAEEEN